MGSVCCVPSKGQSSDTRERWPGGPSSDPAHWRVNDNLSPPLSTRWDAKSFPEDAIISGNGMHLYRSSFSSSSRGSRRGSSRFGAHQRAVSGAFFSPDPSPSSSFRSAHLNPLSSSQICPLEMVPLPSDSNSSPCMTVSSSKEGCLSGRLSTVSNTPESTPSFYSYSGDCRTQPPPPKQSLSTSSPLMVSKLSKSVREKPPCGVTNVSSSRSPLSDGGFPVRRAESVDAEAFGGGTGSDWWSMLTFSELVASSRRERLRWMSTSSAGGEDVASALEGLDGSDLLALEKIRASGMQGGCVSPKNAAFVCGLCSRWLSQRSPLSAQKMVGSSTVDLPGVGVLSCGHVFHADCLEQATSETEMQDPSCPQCAVLKRMTRGGGGFDGLLKNYGSQVTGTKNGSSSSNNNNNSNKKLSRIGASTDESDLQPNSTKVSPSQQQQNFSGECNRSSKRPFSLRSYKHNSSTSKNGSLIEQKVRKSSSFSSQVSPESQALDGSPRIHHHGARRGSFRYLRGW